jgi:imidazolonepropionase-like amidohydrolase
MKRTIADLIIHSAAEVVTCRESAAGGQEKTTKKGQRPPSKPRRGVEQGDAGIVQNGAVAIKGGRIVGVGATEDILPAFRGEETTLLDASGKTVTPGLVDAHTHLAWAGWRDEEYELRLKGATYL